MCLKLKNDEVTIIGRGRADGINHQNWLHKEYTSLKIMSTEGLVLPCMIYAMEIRDVATAEIPGSFLQTDYRKGFIRINMEGAMVTLLEDIYPAYYKDFIYMDILRKNAYMHNPRRIYMEL